MAACQLFREDGKITQVLAENQEPSKLYSKLLDHVNASDVNGLILVTPYLQDRLKDGTLLNTSPEEIALGLWSMAYTPEYKSFIAPLIRTDLSKKLLLDDNGEPKSEPFLSHISNIDQPLNPVARPSVLSPDQKTFTENVRRKGNAIQKKIIDILHLSPENPVTLEEKSHVYTDSAGTVYTSVTTAIKGQLKDPTGQYEINRLYGQAFDKILQGVIEGISYEDLKKEIKNIDEATFNSAYIMFQAYIAGVTSDGSVVLTQVVAADQESGIAGSLDMLVISPQGKIKIVDLKVSKNSVKEDKYSKTAYSVGVDAKLTGSLTTKQQHGIQVAAYKRLIELQGFEVTATETLHVKLDLNTDKTIKKFEFEGLEFHEFSANEIHVDKFIKAKPATKDRVANLRKMMGLNNPADDPEFLSEEEAKPENEELSADKYRALEQQTLKVIDIFKQRQKYLEGLKDSISFKPKAETINKIAEFIVMLNINLESKRPDLAYGEFLKYTKAELEGILNFAIDPTKKGNASYATVLIEADKFIESYRGIIKMKNYGSQEQQTMLINLINLLDETQSAIQDGLREHVGILLKENHNQPLTEEELQKILKEGYDISMGDYNLGDIATSTDPLLAAVDRIFKNGKNEAADRADAGIHTIRSAAEALLKQMGVSKPGPTFYDFMKTFDKLGKWTGRIVSKVGSAYWDKYWAINNMMLDEKKERRKYIFIGDLATADQSEIDFNIKLYHDKKIERAFKNYETMTESGPAEGEWHRLTDEFQKVIRPQYQQIKYTSLPNGKTISSWEKRPEVSEKDYKTFQSKYYNQVKYKTAVIEKDGSFLGRIKEETGYFVKSEYVEVRDISSTGVDLRDPKWVKLEYPQTELEKAQSTYYKKWTETMNGQLENLPPSVQSEMKGKAARVADRFIDNLQKKGEGFFKVFGRTIRRGFQPTTQTEQRMVDESGQIAAGIPITFVGKLQNEGRVSWLKQKLVEIDQQRIDKTIEHKEYLAEKKKFREMLQQEEGKLKVSEIESDMTENLVAFIAMAENYVVMAKIENDLKAIAKVIEDREYIQTDSFGRKLIRKITNENEEQKSIYKRKGDARVPQRMKKWFKMIYYNHEEFNKTTLDMVGQRIMNLTSLKGNAFNPFSDINNYVMGRINTSIETAGAQYYARKAAMRAVKAYNTEFIPGYLSKIGVKGSYYAEKSAKSKYEALASHFRIMRKTTADSGRVDALSIGYLLREGGEYNLQTKSGIAILMTKQVVNKITGESLSLYDAYEFNPNTGAIKLKKGFEFSDKERHVMTNYILEVNKQIHGNYAFEDRMVIQEHFVGQMAAQFHKWLYPAYKVRFKARYYDGNLGEVEGRYRTVYSLLLHIKDAEGDFITKMRTGWAGMDAVQVANMYKNLAELAFFAASFAMYGIFTRLAEGVDDEDEVLKKWVNFMSYQSTRQLAEISTLMPVVGFEEQWMLAKTPFAMIGTLQGFTEAIKETFMLPIGSEQDIIYQRGVHKGGYKATKEWADIIPIMSALNKWENFENVKSFYIK